MKLKELKENSDITLELSYVSDYVVEMEDMSKRYGYGKCIITDYTESEKIIKFPERLYNDGYNRIVTTIGKNGNIILYTFKRGKYARKFISDFTHRGLKTFVAYNEIEFPKFNGELAHEMMKNGKIMKLDGHIYCIKDDVLYLRFSHDDGWRVSKKKHKERNDWIEFRG